MEKDIVQIHICTAMPGSALDERIKYPAFRAE
jgi:hypothetical protein